MQHMSYAVERHVGKYSQRLARLMDGQRRTLLRRSCSVVVKTADALSRARASGYVIRTARAFDGRITFGVIPVGRWRADSQCSDSKGLWVSRMFSWWGVRLKWRCPCFSIVAFFSAVTNTLIFDEQWSRRESMRSFRYGRLCVVSVY